MPKCELGFFLVILLLCLASHRKGLRAQAAVRKLFRASGFGIKKSFKKYKTSSETYQLPVCVCVWKVDRIQSDSFLSIELNSFRV